MALFSINLAILNLLPIPVLDGGHILFLGIEATRGRPLSTTQKLRLSQVGLAFLVLLMAGVHRRYPAHRRILNPVVLTLTLPRSGTTLLHTYFREGWGEGIARARADQHAARLRHLFRCFDAERQDRALQDPVIGGLVRELVRSAETRPVLVFGNTLSHLAPVFHRLLGDRLRLLHLHRDPVVTAASIFVKTRPEWWSRAGRFEDDTHGLRITPFDPHARFREYRSRWASLTLFEAILYQWLERHAFALERGAMTDVAFLSLRSEDLFADPAAAVETVARFFGVSIRRARPRTAARAGTRAGHEASRAGRSSEEWRVYGGHIHVIELARRLGHPMDPDWLEREMVRYQLPRGLLPWLRHRTGFWERRARRALAPTERHRAARCRRSRGPAATTAFRGAPRSSVPPAGAMTRRPPGGGGGAADVRGTTGRRRIDRRSKRGPAKRHGPIAEAGSIEEAWAVERPQRRKAARLRQEGRLSENASHDGWAETLAAGRRDLCEGSPSGSRQDSPVAGGAS